MYNVCIVNEYVKGCTPCYICSICSIYIYMQLLYTSIHSPFSIRIHIYIYTHNTRCTALYYTVLYCTVRTVLFLPIKITQPSPHKLPDTLTLLTLHNSTLTSLFSDSSAPAKNPSIIRHPPSASRYPLSAIFPSAGRPAFYYYLLPTTYLPLYLTPTYIFLPFLNISYTHVQNFVRFSMSAVA